MPTFPGIRSAGEDIANAMIYHHKKHVEYDEALRTADALSRIGIDPNTGRPVQIQMDEKGKPLDKNIIPAIDPKALEAFRTGNFRDMERNAGALETLTRLGVQYINRASSENIEPKYPVQVGGQTYPLPANAAATIGIRREENEAQALAAIPREKRAERREVRAEEASKREDVRLGLATAAGRRAEIEKRPEIQFSRKYGLTPQALIGLQETGYVAKNKEGQELGRTGPLPAGVNAKDYTYTPPWWKEVITLGMAKPDYPVWEAQDTKDKVFRESKYEYPGSAKDQRAKQTQYRANPEGEFLNVRGTRIPIGEVNTVQNSATAAQQELTNTLASPKFQAYSPEQQTAKILLMKQRLSELGYNPDDAFWGLQQQGP